MGIVKTYYKSTQGDLNVSANFKVREFACSDGSDKVLIDTDLVEYLQRIRNHFNAAVTITSGYRTPSHNASPSVGGSPNSRHIYGQAADFYVSGVSVDEVAKYAESIGILGIGKYTNSNYVHIDTRSTKYFWLNSDSNSVSTFGATSISSGYHTSDSTVSSVQQSLNSQYGAGLTVDGKYGVMTRGGLIKALQKEVGAAVDGIFGAETKSKCPTLVIGDSGQVVWVLQAFLYCLGYNPNGIDGRFGNGTANAVSNFQRDNGLSPVDGSPGPRAFEKMCTNLPGSNGSVSSEGSADIAAIQANLNAKYNAGLETDGKFGPLTRIAIVRGFQQEIGVTVDGIFGPKSKAACPVLRLGDSGNKVYLVQAMIHCRGYYINGVDGKYGSGTASAVSNYQADKRLSVDGRAGPNTCESLFAGVDTSSPGSGSVREVQSWLNANYGSGLQVDGLFGPLTREALIKALQQEIGVTADGRFGPVTKAACPILRNGSSGKTVYILQGALICREFNPNGLDGKFGNGCEAAVRSFQSANGLSVDGEAGPNTFEALLYGTANTGDGGGSPEKVVGIKGKTIFIDPGHGGSDPGACGNGLKEKDITLKLSLLQKELFEAKGYTVILSRSRDTDVTIEQRANHANGTNAGLFISNHINAAADSSANGVEVYHSVNSSTGKAFAQRICSNLSSMFTNRGAKVRLSNDFPGQDYYGVIRRTTMTALLVEHCFITNTSDAAKLKSDSNLRQMAQKVVDAVHTLWPENPRVPNPNTGDGGANRDFFEKLDLLFELVQRYRLTTPPINADLLAINLNCVAYIRKQGYDNLVFNMMLSHFPNDLNNLLKQSDLGTLTLIEPQYGFTADLEHCMVAVEGIILSGLSSNFGDICGWGGDIIALGGQLAKESIEEGYISYGDYYSRAKELLSIGYSKLSKGSNFSMADSMADADAVYLASQLKTRPFNEVLREYYTNSNLYGKRFSTFFKMRFNNSFDQVYNAAVNHLESRDLLHIAFHSQFGKPNQECVKPTAAAFVNRLIYELINGEVMGQSTRSLTIVDTAPRIVSVSVEEGVTKDISIESSPNSGTVAVADGDILFTPTEMMVKDDSFTYLADGETATVEIEYADSIRYEQDFAGITAAGPWNTVQSSLYSGGSSLRSGDPNAEIHFTFEGVGIDIIGCKSASSGMFSVTLDGVETEVDCYHDSSDQEVQNVVFSAITMDEGPHSVTIRPLGRKNPLSSGTSVDIDAIDIRGVLQRTEDDIEQEVAITGTAPVIIHVADENGTPMNDIKIATSPESGTVSVTNNRILFTPTKMAVKNDSFMCVADGRIVTVNLKYPEIIRYEQDFGAITTTGTWSTVKYYLSSGGSVLRSSDPEAELHFTFEGSGINIIGYESASRGIFSVTLDGMKTEVDCYHNSYDQEVQKMVFNVEGLAEGTHYVSIRPLGKKNPLSIGTTIDIDAIEIINQSAVSEGSVRDDEVVITNMDPKMINVSVNDSKIGEISITENPESGAVTVIDRDILFTPDPSVMYVKDQSFKYNVGGQEATVALKYDKILYDETFPAITRNGSWSAASFSQYSGGTVLRSSQKDATLTFSFTGSGIDILTYLSPSRGKFSVQIDDDEPMVIDCYNSIYDTYTQRSAFHPDKEGNPDKGNYPVTVGPGIHEVTIKVLGEKNPKAVGTQIDIDAIVIYK